MTANVFGIIYFERSLFTGQLLNIKQTNIVWFQKIFVLACALEECKKICVTPTTT
jgi:hypothetical protein